MEEIVEVAKLCLKREFLENPSAEAHSEEVKPRFSALLFDMFQRGEALKWSTVFPHTHVSAARMVQTWRKRTGVESHRGHGILTCNITALRCVLRSTHGCVQNCVHSRIRRLRVAP